LSVIYNALKKTQETREEQQKIPPKKSVLLFSNLVDIKRKWIQLIMCFAIAIIIAMMVYTFKYSLTSAKSLPANTVTSEKLTLTGILISEKTKIAMINKQTYSLGDTIQGKKIVSIHLNGIRLQDGNNIEELPLRT